MDKNAQQMSKWLATGKFNAKDEYYTPPCLVRVILPFVKREWTVWCPFDTEDSEFVILLKENGNKVIHSHIWNGQDFFAYEPQEHYDAIISNPPFTRKLEVISRMYALGKPFALVMGLPVLNYQEVGEFFIDKPLQLLIVDKKVSFDGHTASFNNSFFCNGILPKDLMFAHLDNNNSGNFFVGSRMKPPLNCSSCFDGRKRTQEELGL